MNKQYPPSVRPQPGSVRLAVITLICLLLALGGAATALTAYRSRMQIARGWEDATVSPNLPFRAPLAGVNVDLTQYTDPATLNTALDQIAAAGFTWVRQTFSWASIAPSNNTDLQWTAYDPIVQAVAAHKSLKLIAVLDESPLWARQPGAEGSRYAPPSSPAQFGAFAGTLAARYGSAINTYQIWDEPNLNTHWGGLDPAPAGYLALLRAAYTAIHAANANSTVIAAALAPTIETGPRNLNDPGYLDSLYALGGQAYFDAAAAKPYGFNSSPDDRTVNAGTLNFSRIILLREVMIRHGDSVKPLWGSNFGWNSLPADWKGAPSIWGQVDPATQEAYTKRAYQRALTEWPWLAGLILEHWQPNAPSDDPIQGFAIADKAASWAKDGIFGDNKPDVLSSGVTPMTDRQVQYAGQWRTGPLGADVGQNADGSLSSFSVPIDGGTGGNSVGLRVRRDDYVAYLYVTLDGQPVNALPTDTQGQSFVLLTSPDRQPHLDSIVVARNIPPGLHTLQVRAYLSYDRWALAGIAVGTPPNTSAADRLLIGGIGVLLIALIGVGFFGRKLPWRRTYSWRTSLFSYGRQMRGFLFGITMSIATAIGIFLTWGGALPNLLRRDPPAIALTVITAGLIYFSPALIVTLISALALFLVIYQRPPLGLALTIFWAPFFLFPIELYVSAATMVEVSLFITLAATIARGLVTWLSRAQIDRVMPTIRLRFADWVVIAFAAIAVLTLVWSAEREPAIRELRTMVLDPVIFYFLMRIIAIERRDVLRIVDALLLAGLTVAVIGFAGYFHLGGAGGVVIAEQGSERLSSVYGSPNNVALFLGRCIPFAIAMALFPLSTVRRVTAGVLAVIMLIAVVLTQSIGALAIGLPAALVVIALAWRLRPGIGFAIGLGVLEGGALIVLPRFIPRLQGALTGARASSLIRTELWHSALNLIREHPMTGAGLDQFLYLYRSRYILPDAYQEPDLSHPHNLILDYWISLGIGGLMLLIALQAAFWSNALIAYRKVRHGVAGYDPLLLALVVGAMGSMADFLAHGLVDNSYFVVDLSFVFCFTLALAVWLRGTVDPAKANPAAVSVVSEPTAPQLDPDAAG